MTVSTTASRVEYAGNGVTTTFSIPFRFLENSDISITSVSALGVATVLSQGAEYTLTGSNDDDGGTAILTAAAAAGSYLIIQRTVEATQETDYISGDPFPAESHERALDKLTMLVQQGDEASARTLKFPATDLASQIGELPPAAQRANSLLAFDAVGRPSLTVPSDQSATTLALALQATGGASMIGFIQDAPDAVPQTLQDQARVIFTPMNFGAVGNGIADDGPALNRAIAFARAKIDAAPFANTTFTLDLAGRTFVTNISINATGLREGFEIRNGVILGKCTGKAVFDTIGSRSLRMTNFIVVGDQTNRPSVGIQTARSSVNPDLYGFCDGFLWDRVFVNGYFSTAAVHIYGQEGTLYSRCKWWNSDRDAYVAILTGFNSVPMFSDYMAPVTGSVSYINNKYVNVDFMFLPIGASAAITGISKATSAVVTAPGHPFQNGDFVSLSYVNGMTQINNFSATVANRTANTFELAGVNSTAFSTYTSGGQVVINQTKPTIRFARGEQHHFDTCYCVNYGTDSIQIDFPDGAILKSVWFDFLFEGAGSQSHVVFTGPGTISAFKLLTYNTHARDFIMRDSGAATVALTSAEIVVTNSVYSAPMLFNDNTKFALYGASVSIPSAASFDYTTMFDRFTGTLRYASTGASFSVNSQFADYRNVDFVPTITPGAGAFGSVTVQKSFVRRMGNAVFFQVDFTIVAVGTAAGSLTCTNPYDTTMRQWLHGSEFGVSGQSVKGMVLNNTINITRSDGSIPLASGQRYSFSGWYYI